MKLVLIPKSHPECGEIEIDEGPFAVGRLEEPFASRCGEEVNRLSRRHARIIQEGSTYYVADLGSLNGTQVNGKNVKQHPVSLNQGDVVRFGSLEFTVEFPEVSAEEETLVYQPSTMKLTLSPIKEDAGLDIIVITRFPFLVSKIHGVFAGYQENMAEHAQQLSRRHALIFHRSGKFFVEDLGSTNGTFVDGDRLGEQARELRDGTGISFGDEQFSYSVTLQADTAGEEDTTRIADVQKSTDSALPGNEVERPDTEHPGTVFVSKASSFLDMYLQDDDQPAGEVAGRNSLPGGKTAEKAEEPDSGKAVQAGPLSRAGVFLKELAGSLSSEGERSARNKWIWLGGILLVAGIMGLVYLHGASESKIKSLIASSKYEQAVRVANEHLADHPDDEALGRLATQALMRMLIPEWNRQLEQGDFQAATELLNEAKEDNRVNREALQSLEVLSLAGDLAAFIDSRGSETGSLDIFGQDNKIITLLDRWESDKATNRRILNTIRQYAPSFEDRYELIYSQMRQLQIDKTVNLGTIQTFRKKILAKLAADQAGELFAEFDEFEEKYPDLHGIDDLRTDLESYLVIKEAMDGREIQAISEAQKRTSFITPVFTIWYEEQLSRQLPDQRIMEEFPKSTAAWAAGDSDTAISILEPMVDDSMWGKVVQKRLDHYQKVTNALQRLQSSQGDADYEEKVLAFYAMLDVDRDKYYEQLIGDDFKKVSDKAVTEANESFNQAENAWAGYQEGGGIGGLLRLENQISSAYRNQAGLLATAEYAVNTGAGIYRDLGLNIPATHVRLENNIHAEMKRQRQWISDLGKVIDPRLLEEKLRLLEYSEPEDEEQ